MVPLSLDGELLQPAGTLRFRFHKVGELQYISHLDLVRTLTKVIVRAGLPVWYTEGFNPKPRLSFATPMSVGLESDCEFMDLKVNRRVDTRAAMEAFNRNLTAACCADEVYVPTTKFTDIATSSYIFRIHTAGGDAAMAEACLAALTAEDVTVHKKTKSGEKDVNIRSWYRDVTADFANGDIVLTLNGSVAGDTFLNPELLITYLKGKLGILGRDLLREYYSIRRTGLYTRDMTPFR